MTAVLSSAAGSLSSLLRQTTITDHEALLKAADASLSKSKNDIDAQHVKVVALLKLDRFEDALRTLQSGGEKLKERARLEWAYALYKTGEPAKAAEVARQGAERGIRHVEAQASYRMEDFQRASELYATLTSQRGEVSNEDVDLGINSGAVDAQLEWGNQGHLVQKKKPTREDMEAFETAYNAACGSIARGELGQAEVLLKRSKDLCNALDDMSEEDKRAEILPISVQHIYVLTRQGRLEEADKIASTIKSAELLDVTSQHIARINTLAASSGSTNPFLAQRLIQVPAVMPKSDKPFAYQSSVLRQNDYAVSLLSQKYPGTAESTATTISSHTQPTLDSHISSLSVVNAAANARNRTGKEALKALLPVLEKRPNDVGLLLVVLQLHVSTGNHDSALTLLEAFLDRLSRSSTASDLDVRYAPGLVGTLTALYTARNQTSHVRAELAKAARHWQRRSKDSSQIANSRSTTHLLKTAGSALLESSKSDDLVLASSIFHDLHARNPEDRYTSAGLVASLAAQSPSDITDAELASLTPVPRLITGIDVAALEAAGVAKPATEAPAPASTKRSATTSSAPRKAKKIRPSRLPKDYDANKMPDPERWLPLKDRSSYRPKGRKNKARLAMLMQGGAVAAADESREASVSRPGTPAVVAPPGVGGKQAAKKKKGKGGKW